MIDSLELRVLKGLFVVEGKYSHVVYRRFDDKYWLKHHKFLDRMMSHHNVLKVDEYYCRRAKVFERYARLYFGVKL